LLILLWVVHKEVRWSSKEAPTANQPTNPCPPLPAPPTRPTARSRLFPADRDAADRSGNAPPGTVVDAAVCSPAAFDFYLTSHASLTGQTKGAHYAVAVDESGFSGDGLVTLTYWLTYLFARCTRCALGVEFGAGVGVGVVGLVGFGGWVWLL